MDYPQQLATNAAPFNGCNQPLIATNPTTCAVNADCPLGYTCNATNALAGFENVTGQELEPTKCFAGGVSGPLGDGLSGLKDLITERGFVTRADVGNPLRPPACRDFQQQFCSQPLVSGIACASAADCPLGNACNFTTLQCEAVNDACANNPAGIPNDDPAVP